MSSAENDNSPTLAIDACGGAVLRGRCGNADDGRRLVLAEAALRALDLHADSRLEVIDVRGCGADDAAFHLQLDSLPGLRELWLPARETGAVIHLYSPGLPRSLRIHGALSHLDADWQAGQLLLSSDSQPWQGAMLWGHDANAGALEQLCQPQALNILLVPGLWATGRLSLQAAGTLHIADTDTLEQLRVEGPVALRLGRGPALTTLSLVEVIDFEGEQLDRLAQVDAGPGIEQAQDLAAALAGPAPACDLKLRGRMTGLRLLDGWRHVQLHTPALRTLALNRAESLSLHFCAQLETVGLPATISLHCEGTLPAPLIGKASFHVDEATLSQALARLEAGETALLPGVLAMLARTRGGNEVFHALKVLERLAGLGLDADALWQCRRELAAWQIRRHQQLPALGRSALQRGDRRWEWPLPRDRFDEGIAADLQLWSYCQRQSTVAAAWRTVLLREIAQGQRKLPVLVRLAARPQTDPVLTRLLIDAMVSIHQKEAGKDYFLHHPCGGHRKLLRLYAHWPLTTQEREALLSAIVQLQPWQNLPQALPQLFAPAPALVRHHLMQLGRREDNWLYRWLGDRPSAAAIRQARQWLLQLALLPRQATRTTNLAAAANDAQQTEEIEA